MNKNKTRWIGFRATEILFRKLVAISRVTGKSKSAIISDLICAEYDKNKKYERWYDADLDKKV